MDGGIISHFSVVGGLGCFHLGVASGCSSRSQQFFLGTRSHPTMGQESLVDRREGACRAFSPTPGWPLMSWKVGRQLLALTSTGCTRLASTLDHSVEPIWAPPGHQEPGQGLLEPPCSSLSLLTSSLCSAGPPLPHPQPFHQGMNELGRGLWPVTNYFQKSLVTRQVGLRQTPALLSPSCCSRFRKHNFEGEAR